MKWKKERSLFRFSIHYRKPVLGWKSMGMDFGSQNSSICVLDQTSFKILHLSMVPDNLLIQNFREKETRTAVTAFMGYVEDLIVTHKPSVFIGELYFVRGPRNQNVGKCMFMLALTAAVCQKYEIEFRPVNSGAWKAKGWLQKVMPVEKLYALKLKKFTHLTDAVMLALYADKDNLHRLGEQGLMNLIGNSSIPGRRIAKPKPEKKPRAKRVTRKR